MSIKLSYCTCLFNRAEQLKQVWQNNVLRVQADSDLEWVIYDWGSDDGIFQWVMERLPRISARIVYVRSGVVFPFHISKAKNLAHFCSTGKILMNLDGDNFIVDKTKGLICGYIPRKADCIQLCHNLEYHEGTYGRIAIDRELFFELGMYEESLPSMGCQDIDLTKRVLGYGKRFLYVVREEGYAVQHGDDIRMKYMPETYFKSMEEVYNASRVMSEALLGAKKWIANDPGLIDQWRLHVDGNCVFHRGSVNC